MVNGYPNVFMIILSGKHYRPALHHSGLFLLYEITLIICFAIGSECFARRGSKGSLPVHILSRAGYCGAKPVPQGASFARSDSGQELRPRLPYGSYSGSLALAMLTYFYSMGLICFSCSENQGQTVLRGLYRASAHLRPHHKCSGDWFR